MRQLTHVFRPAAGQLELIKSRAREVLISGPDECGKTRGALEKLVYACSNRAYTRVLLAGPTTKTLNEVVRPPLVNDVMALYLNTNKDYPDHRPVWPYGDGYRFSNGSVIQMLGVADWPERLMPERYDFVYLAKANQVTEADWERLVSLLGNGVYQYPQAIAEQTAGSAQEWTLRRALDGGMDHVRMAHRDCHWLRWTSGHRSARGKELFARLDAMTGNERLRHREGMWIA